MEHLKFLGGTTSALTDNASFVDAALKDLETKSLLTDEQVGVSTLFAEYKPQHALADLGQESFLLVQSYLGEDMDYFARCDERSG